MFSLMRFIPKQMEVAMFEKKKTETVNEVMTFFGKGTHFKGVLTFEGTARIDGEIEGEVITQGTLIVGESGIIRAEITAGAVIVGGKVNGNIHASQKIQLLPKSVVTGSLTTHSIIIEDGALLNGICEMQTTVEPEYKAWPEGKPLAERDSYKENATTASPHGKARK
jgi:cytoskeletal protein CcmA (bactofilin family)